jgi:molybdate transport system substrate-binding protein
VNKEETMKKLSVLVAAIACFALALALTGCGSQAKKDVELQIFAANSLEKALPEVQALYTEQNGNVTFADTQFKGSNDLVAEIQGGASADLLIYASKGTMDTMEEGGYIDTATRSDLFVNDLIVVTADGSKIAIDDLSDLATNDEVTSIAIGDPNVVPAGKYALESFADAGLVTYDVNGKTIENIVWDDAIASKINAGADKVGTVASYVSEGQCDTGLVYTSDLYRYEGLQNAYTVPAEAHSAIIYPAAVTADSENADVAADFLEFCTTNEDALKIWQKYGFELA